MKDTSYSIQVSPDLLHVTLHCPAKEGETVQLASGEELNELLIQKGIVHGLHLDTIAKAAAYIEQAEPFANPLVLATGTPPISGSQGMCLEFAPQIVLIEETDEHGENRQSPINLAPLVRPGDILAQPGPPVSSRPGKDIFGQELPCPLPQELNFLPGEHVVFDEGKKQLIAAASGYPGSHQKEKGPIGQYTLSITKLITVTPEKTEAILSLRPPLPGHTLPTKDTILQILDEENIIVGRLPHAIEQCLDTTEKVQRPQQAVVALGNLPVNGTDASLRLEVDFGSLPGKLLEHDQIDFRERNMFFGVDKDQLIAIKVPATLGTPGRDVFGATAIQVPGKDLIIKMSDNTVYNDETHEVRAACSGVLSVVSEGSIKVCSKLIISNDVDYSTGNILARDSLEIKGSVKEKFRVNALGDILISGVVEKETQVRSDSNVVVKGGMHGILSAIRARGDVDVTIVEHGRIYAGGSIIMRKSAYFCRLHAGANLHCDPSSKIVHSQLVAAGSITTGNVGSNNADPSLLAAAVIPAQLEFYHELKRAITAKTEIIEAWKMRINSQAEANKLDELLAELEEIKHKFALLNLISSDAPKSSRSALMHAMQCSIAVQGKIFADTKIRIGNSRMVLEETMSNVRFQLQDSLAATDLKKQPDIVIIPLKK